jgi:hypothetical protein
LFIRRFPYVIAWGARRRNDRWQMKNGKRQMENLLPSAAGRPGIFATAITRNDDQTEPSEANSECAKEIIPSR